MSYDYSKLLGRIIERLGTQYKFAQAIGLSERSVSLKLNGKIGWKQEEIIKICRVLEIESKDIPYYFFAINVQKN